MNQSTHQLAQRLNRDADRLSDRPMPAELDKIRGQIRRLWVAIDMEYTQEILESEQVEERRHG